MGSVETPSQDSRDQVDSLLEAVAATPEVRPSLALRVRPDATIENRYRLERRIGEGGMGVVWAARDLERDERVALKFLKKLDASPTQRRRLLREAETAGAIRHPNVVRVEEVFELEDGSPVMVMELLEGESLAARIDRQGKLSLEETARILLVVVTAVGTAHAKGIVHRDLKPHNIFLSDGTVKVLDFGIAKLVADDDRTVTTGLTGSGAMLGTPCYMSPEQVFAERRIDHRADVWALGIILYECLSGVLPTRADNVGQVLKVIVEQAIAPLAETAPEVPKDVSDLVGRMLSRKPESRPSLQEVFEVLSRQVEALRLSASFGPAVMVSQDEPQSPSEAGRPSKRGWRRWSAWAAAGALAATLAIASSWWRAPEEAPASPPAPTGTAERGADRKADSQPLSPDELPAEPSSSPSAPRVEPLRLVPRDPLPPRAPPSEAPSAPPSASASPERLPGGVVRKPPF